MIAALLAVGTTGWMPAAASGAETAGEPRAVPNELLVTYQPGATPAQKAKTRSAAKAVATEQVAGGAHGAREVELVTLAVGQSVAGTARRLQADPAVVAAEPNWIYTTEVTPSEPYFTNGSLWGMNGGYGSGASTAWAANHTGSTGVYVGVIDEGIQFTHPDLDANVWTNPFDPADGIDNDGNGYVDDVHGWDFANRDNSIYDGGSKASLDNHGTHVSGTIGAEANGTGVVGVSWNVTLISGKFLGRRGGTTADAIKAVDYFTDLKTRHGLNIVATNNSWSGGSYSKALSDAIERANAANILFVAAAGNGGSDGAGDNNDTAATYPASYANSNVIAVAAIDAQGNRASFSNYGATTVDLGAPGVGVLSTTAESTYSNYSGTSMAAPHVTGAAALYASTHPGATATQIKQAILATAIPTPSLQGRTVTGGRLDTSSF